MNARRAGFTLSELLVTIVIGAFVLASVYKTLITQERSIRQSYAVIGTQENVRTAVQIMGADLREVSATDGDIVAADSTSITINALRKAGLICNVSGGQLDVAEVGDPFVSGDSILVFSDGPSPVSGFDDVWLRRNVSSANPPAGACVGNPVSANIRHLILGTGFTDVYAGAPVRSFVRITYSLVDSAGKGMLRRTMNGTAANIIEDLSTTANRGLRLAYWDSTGAAMSYATLNANLTKIGRIQLRVRGTQPGGQTGNNRNFVDSLFTTTQMRGNLRLR